MGAKNCACLLKVWDLIFSSVERLTFSKPSDGC